MHKQLPTGRKRKRLQKNKHTNASLMKSTRKRPGSAKSSKNRDKSEPKRFFKSLKRKALQKLDVKRSWTLSA